MFFFYWILWVNREIVLVIRETLIEILKYNLVFIRMVKIENVWEDIEKRKFYTLIVRVYIISLIFLENNFVVFSII